MFSDTGMDFGQPEVLVTFLVMLFLMFLNNMYILNLINKANEEASRNDVVAMSSLGFMCGQFFSNLQGLSADDDQVQVTVKKHGLPRLTNEAVLYVKVAMELYTNSLKDSIGAVFNHVLQAPENQQHRERAKKVARRTTLFTAVFMAWSTFLVLLQLSHPFGHFQDASTIHNATSGAGSSSIFEYAAAMKQSYSQSMTPYYVDSAPMTKSEGEALYQLLHSKEGNTDAHEDDDSKVICCQENDLFCFASSLFSEIPNSLGSQFRVWARSLTENLSSTTVQDASTIRYSTSEAGSSSIFEYAAAIEQSYSQQVTPSHILAVPMTKSEGQALYELLYGSTEVFEEIVTTDQEEPLLLDDFDEAKTVCCKGNDYPCLVSSIMPEIRRSIDNVYTYSAGLVADCFKNCQGILSTM